MYIFIVVVHIIACLVLILVILLQAGRGGGMSEAFGMSSTSTIFGTSASKFLQKMTSVCAIIFLITSLGLTVISSRSSKSLMRMEYLKKALPEPEKHEIPQQEKTDETQEPVKEETPVEK